MKKALLKPGLTGMFTVLCIAFANAQAQYNLNNNLMKDLLARDSFYVSYSLGAQKDTGIVHRDTFVFVKMDSFISYHTTHFDMVSDGVHLLIVHHKTKRIILGPETQGILKQFVQHELRDTGVVNTIDSTDTISPGYRVYTIHYMPNTFPYCSKIVKMNLQTGFAEEVKMGTCYLNKSNNTAWFNVLNMRLNGFVAPPFSISDFLHTSGPPAGWLAKSAYNAYTLINYY